MRWWWRQRCYMNYSVFSFIESSVIFFYSLMARLWGWQRRHCHCHCFFIAFSIHKYQGCKTDTFALSNQVLSFFFHIQQHFRLTSTKVVRMITRPLSNQALNIFSYIHQYFRFRHTKVEKLITFALVNQAVKVYPIFFRYNFRSSNAAAAFQWAAYRNTLEGYYKNLNSFSFFPRRLSGSVMAGRVLFWHAALRRRLLAQLEAELQGASVPLLLMERGRRSH